jgi:hypothetical protein
MLPYRSILVAHVVKKTRLLSLFLLGHLASFCETSGEDDESVDSILKANYVYKLTTTTTAIMIMIEITINIKMVKNYWLLVIKEYEDMNKRCTAVPILLVMTFEGMASSIILLPRDVEP